MRGLGSDPVYKPDARMRVMMRTGIRKMRRRHAWGIFWKAAMGAQRKSDNKVADTVELVSWLAALRSERGAL